ncbi:MAG TPA: NADH-quinone oxidoreductase subunit N [Pirellulaceae bacterium]|nr:NADH-quinone oxidoreductase subunit N [Pirellulaceae bacterium]
MLVEWNTLGLLRPEIILVAAATTIFVGGAFAKSRAWWALFALISYVAAGAALASYGPPWAEGSTLSGPVTIDPLSLSLRWLAVLMGLVFTLVATRLADPEIASEYVGSLMLVATGVMLTASANELVLLFLGLELISIPTYVLLFLGRRDRAAGEATMKYFYLSILSSALLLYGFSFLYGIGGTTLIAGTAAHPGIREAFLPPLSLGEGRGEDSESSAGDASPRPNPLPKGEGTNPLAPLAPLAVVLILAGLGFKLAIAPLQFYAPDVYQGTTNANAGLLAVAPKIAGVAGLVRLLVVAMPSSAEFAWQLALILSILTMTIGNICALWQSNVRRLMAYSSIAHGGYLLIGLAAAAGAISAGQPLASGGVTAMLFYVAVYALATMGTFAALAYLGSPRRELDGVEQLAGLSKSQPVIAGAIAVFMFSLAGIPPLAGFWGKLTLFGSAVELATAGTPAGMSLWFTILVVIGALNAAVAAAYYLRIVAVMYFQPAAAAPSAAGGRTAHFAALLLAVLVIAAGILPGRLLDAAARSEIMLQSDAPQVAATP